MDAVERLVQRVTIEQDDILATLQLVRGDDVLEARLFEQLVDLLVESMFLGLRQQHLDGAITPEAYIEELRALAAMCRGVGLLPMPSTDA